MDQERVVHIAKNPKSPCPTIMSTTVHEVKPLTNEALNELVKSVEVRFDNDQTLLVVEKWIRLTCGEIEVYIGDHRLVVTFTDTFPTDPEEVEYFAHETKRTVIDYLTQEGFIKPNWVYVGFQNANSLSDTPTFE